MPDISGSKIYFAEIGSYINTIITIIAYKMYLHSSNSLTYRNDSLMEKQSLM